MDVAELAHYPFRPEVPEVVRSAGVGIDDVLKSTAHTSTRRRALERIEGALGDGFAPAKVTDSTGGVRELLSVALARMLCVAVADRQLIRRYAQAEAESVARALGHAQDRLVETASLLGITLAPGAPGQTPWQVDVPTYLRVAPVAQPHWKMMLRPVGRGMVHISQDDAVGLCREALRARIEAELEAECSAPLPASLRQGLAGLLERIAPALEEARQRWSTGDFGPVQPGLFPPCITHLFAQMKEGANIPHHGRFAFASFMGTIGMTAEQIMDYLSTTPNFDREKSRYQIEHITGERGVEAYTPPGCQTMQTNGVCPLDKRDGLCMKIKHPLSYYRAKLRFQEEDRRKADEALAKGARRAQEAA